MVSPELLRRYPFFAGLSMDQIASLAKVAEEISVDEGHYFFHEGEELHHFYLVLEGAVGIMVKYPDPAEPSKVSEHLTGEFPTQEAVVSTAGSGDIFAWSGIVAPYASTANGKAITPCRVIAFDCDQLHTIFQEDCRFGYLMMQKAAQVIRERLRDMRIESLVRVVQ